MSKQVLWVIEDPEDGFMDLGFSRAEARMIRQKNFYPFTRIVKYVPEAKPATKKPAIKRAKPAIKKVTK